MPHVREQEYVRPGRQYELEFVELIHRHHKRTPYASNTFPVESYAWDCSDEGLFFYGKPLNLAGKESASTYWSVYTSGSNPFEPHGFNGTCQFPQITRGGLDDSYQHGLDLLGVYHNLRGFLPKKLDESIIYRVTNNVITSQVAGMVVQAMYPSPATANIPLLVQPDSIDSLEPTYSCPTASLLYSSLGPGSSSPAWTAHLSAASSLHTKLDSVSGIPATDGAWHMSFDHYFDNLSSRLCHAKPLPCQVINGTNSTNCITHVEADEVFRLGKYEYNFLYRAAGAWTLQAARARYGVYIAEVSANIRAAIAGSSSVQYRHKIAHDGSVSLLLSILQVDVMVWPGMGAEIVFEIWSKLTGGQKKYFARVFWSGKALRSNNPALGVMDMLDVEDLLVYFDGLVGLNASKVPSLCGIISA
ncbi:MAG: hypothetical protein MMC33_000179 [Icmadophila ericetorum]|nr:hypothetical protein [Icmadophila ericetorum]